MPIRAKQRSSPFTQAVVTSLRKLYPEALADKSFDNTGLLLEAPYVPDRQQRNSVLLTIDLTKAVADEAIARKDSVVVAYHPIIFRGLKALTLEDTQQESLLRLASAGISVYSPHTAVDAVPGGLCDWLADIATGSFQSTSEDALLSNSANEDSRTADAGSSGSQAASVKGAGDGNLTAPGTRPDILRRQYSAPTYPNVASPAANSNTALVESEHDHTRSTIQPAENSVQGFEGAGAGRLITFSTAQPFTQLIERIAHGLGTPAGFPVAIPQWTTVDQIEISTVAVCPGSGGGVFKGVDADLYFTGEMSHHEALAATERGSCVISLFHSNSERGFLSAVMKPKLESLLDQEWKQMKQSIDSDNAKNEPQHQDDVATSDDPVEVECSEQDRDPYGIVILQGSEVQVGGSDGPGGWELEIKDAGKEAELGLGILLDQSNEYPGNEDTTFAYQSDDMAEERDEWVWPNLPQGQMETPEPGDLGSVSTAATERFVAPLPFQSTSTIRSGYSARRHSYPTTTASTPPTSSISQIVFPGAGQHWQLGGKGAASEHETDSHSESTSLDVETPENRIVAVQPPPPDWRRLLAEDRGWLVVLITIYVLMQQQL